MKTALLATALFAGSFLGSAIVVHAQGGGIIPATLYVNGVEVVPLNNKIEINSLGEDIQLWANGHTIYIREQE